MGAQQGKEGYPTDAQVQASGLHGGSGQLSGRPPPASRIKGLKPRQSGRHRGGQQVQLSPSVYPGDLASSASLSAANSASFPRSRSPGAFAADAGHARAPLTPGKCRATTSRGLGVSIRHAREHPSPPLARTSCSKLIQPSLALLPSHSTPHLSDLTAGIDAGYAVCIYSGESLFDEA